MARLFSTVGLAAAVLSSTGHGITVLPGGDPRPFNFTSAAMVGTAEAFWRGSAPNEFANTSASVIISSFDDIIATAESGNEAAILPSSGSFVRGAIQAWGEHLHLVLRPEEVWFTVLVQMNFFMNSHAEEIRHLFVDHEGQQVMYLEETEWFRVIQAFKDEIQRRIKADWLMEWLEPRFTTTTREDTMVATVLMMGLMKAYFKFEGGIICGLPSVTLLGERADWEAMLKKLDRMSSFGEEPAAYAERLRPIFTRFVKTFDEPGSEATKLFWNQIVTARKASLCGGPPYDVSGWITGFFFWDDEGRPYARHGDGLRLDNATYPANIDLRTLPLGYARAPFLMHDFNGTERYEAYVMAGTVGKQVTAGMPEGYVDAFQKASGGKQVRMNPGAHATLQPLSAWMLYGPIPHNASASRWVADNEIPGLFSSLGSNYGRGQCSAKAAPPF
jgi:hypothetical protein